MRQELRVEVGGNSEQSNWDGVPKYHIACDDTVGVGR